MVEPDGYTKRRERRKPLEATLKIGLCGRDEYLVDFKAPGISATTTTRFPLSDRDTPALEAALSEIPFAGIRFQQTPQAGQVPIQEFGMRFFQAIFTKGVDVALKACLEKAQREQRQLRLRLVLLDPRFSALPLEFLFDADQRTYLSLHPLVSLVRAPAQIHALHPFKVKPPLNILAMLSTPLDHKPFDAQQEKAVFDTALAPLQAQGLVSVTWCENWDTLKQAISSETPWHIFHLIGRGAFDSNAEECFIGMADATGKTLSISGHQLASLLRMQPSLRLAFLNVCEGGKAGTHRLFSSAAELLWLQGIQAVVALQTDISDEAALLLTEIFYTQLAREVPVDAALTMARLEISRQSVHTLEWGTLVLYLSSVDAVLFEVIEERPDPTESDNAVGQWVDEGSDYDMKKEYPMALDAYTRAEDYTEDQTSREALQLVAGLRDELAQCEAHLAHHADLSMQLKRIDLLIKLRKHEQAVTACDQLLFELGVTASPLVKQRLYTFKGDAYQALGEHNMADSAYERARMYKPESLS
jgi:CHAT domain-containing protein